MYFIVNISKPPREITIGDLNFCLGPNKAIDLEKVRKRSEIDDSKDLKTAIRNRVVQLRHGSEPKPAEEPKPVVAASTGVSEADLQKIRETVREEFKTQLAQMGQSQGVPSELIELIGKLTSMMEKGGVPNHQSTDDTSVEEEPDTIDERLLVQMSEKTVKNRTKDVEGSIQSEEQKVTGSVTSKAKKYRDLLNED